MPLMIMVPVIWPPVAVPFTYLALLTLTLTLESYNQSLAKAIQVLVI